MNRDALNKILHDMTQLPRVLNESASFGQNVSPAVESCFKGVSRALINEVKYYSISKRNMLIIYSNQINEISCLYSPSIPKSFQRTCF